VSVLNSELCGQTWVKSHAGPGKHYGKDSAPVVVAVTSSGVTSLATARATRSWSSRRCAAPSFAEASEGVPGAAHLQRLSGSPFATFVTESRPQVDAPWAPGAQMAGYHGTSRDDAER